MRTQRSRQLFCSATAETAEKPAAGDAVEVPQISDVSLLVGKILSAENHPDADDVYVEQVEVGESEPRTILSGLRKFCSVEDLPGQSVVVVSNQPDKKIRGIASAGFLLCTSNADHTEVELLNPPEGAAPGERIFFGEEGKDQPAAASPSKMKKKKIWTKVQPFLKTDGDKVPNFNGSPMLTSAGPVQAKMADATIS